MGSTAGHSKRESFGWHACSVTSATIRTDATFRLSFAEFVPACPARGTHTGNLQYDKVADKWREGFQIQAGANVLVINLTSEYQKGFVLSRAAHVVRQLWRAGAVEQMARSKHTAASCFGGRDFCGNSCRYARPEVKRSLPAPAAAAGSGPLLNVHRQKRLLIVVLSQAGLLLNCSIAHGELWASGGKHCGRLMLISSCLSRRQPTAMVGQVSMRSKGDCADYSGTHAAFKSTYCPASAERASSRTARF